MPSDLFPLREYRGHETADLSVKAKIPSAQAITIDTNFDGATADTLAAAALAATKNSVQSYTFTTTTRLKLSDIIAAAPIMMLNHGSIQNYPAKVTSFETRWSEGTSVTVRGR